MSQMENRLSYHSVKQLAKELCRRGQMPLLSVLLALKLLNAFVLEPVQSGIWALGLRFSPVSYITNGDVTALLRAPSRLIAIVLMAFFIALRSLYEFSLILHGLELCLQRKRIRLKPLLLTSARALLPALKPRNLPILLYTALLIPFTNLFMASDYISQLIVPEYIMEVIRDRLLYLLPYAAFVIACVVLAFLGIFTPIGFLLRGKRFSEAFSESVSMVKAHAKGILCSIIRWNIAMLLKWGLITCLGMLLCLAVITLSGQSDPLLMRAMGSAFTYVLMPVLEFFLDVILSVVQFAMLTALYAELRGQELVEESGFKSGSSAPVILALLFSVGLTAAVCACYRYFPEFLPKPPTATITCHRGYSAVAPENTLPAFQAAIDVGADCAELDVQMTKDGVVVVTHDTNLLRCTGHNVNVYDLTFEELRTLDAGSFFSPEFAGTKLPTLEEVIRLCKGKIRLNIEIKQNGHAETLEAETARIIQDNDFVDECVVTSLSYESLVKVKEAVPQIRTGYILALGVGSYYDLPCADFFSVETTFITRGIVSAIHARGKTISAWTIDRENDAEEMLSLGVDDLITGSPLMVRDAIESEEDFGTILYEIYENTRDQILGEDEDDGGNTNSIEERISMEMQDGQTS